jgi:hypothetical protein
VGKGAGDIQMVSIPSKIPGNMCKWLLLIPMTLLVLWLGLPYLSTESTTTTTGVPKSCSIFGDPHAMTFDGKHLDLYTTGEFYIVKSTTVIIQGKYAPTQATNGLAVTKQIAVGGPFLKGHKLIVGEEHTWYDNQLVLTGFPSTFKDPAGLVSIVYNAQGETLQAGREGKSFHVLHVTLPDGVSIQINRWNEPGEGRYINAKITMPPQPDQDGDCGNFNNNPVDDDRLAIRTRLGKFGVPANELLFPGAKTVVSQGIEDCTEQLLTSAHEQCKAANPKIFWPSMSCLKSVCQGGPATA